jgi:hypothetical protein
MKFESTDGPLTERDELLPGSIKTIIGTSSPSDATASWTIPKEIKSASVLTA